MAEKKHRTLPEHGTTFHKNYKGKTYILSVVEQNGRLAYRLVGKSFASPTAAARHLTGYETNGRLFWSVDKS